MLINQFKLHDFPRIEASQSIYSVFDHTTPDL